MENTKSKETINTSNLKKGMRFKSYKALCEFIETKIKVGKLKQNQMNKWKSYFEFHNVKKGRKVTNEIIIDEVKISKELIELKDGRANNGNIEDIYSDSFAPLVISALSEHYNKMSNKNECTLAITSTMIMKDFAMADEDLLEYYHNLDGISSLTNFKNELKKGLGLDVSNSENTIAKDSVTLDFINSYRNKTMSRFNTVLKKLQKYNLIRFYPKSIRIKNIYGEYQWATNEQIKAILDIENEILKEISTERGYTVTKTMLKRYGLQHSFRKKVSEKLQNSNDETLKGVMRYFDAIKIIMSSDFQNMLIENYRNLSNSLDYLISSITIEDDNIKNELLNKNKISNLVTYLMLSKVSDVKTMNRHIDNYKDKKMKQAENYVNNEEHLEEYLNKKWDKNKRGLKTKMIEQWKGNEDIKEEFLEMTKDRYCKYVNEYKDEYFNFIEEFYNKLDYLAEDIDNVVDTTEFIESNPLVKAFKELGKFDVKLIQTYLDKRVEIKALDNIINKANKDKNQLKSQSLDSLISSAEEEEQQQRNTNKSNKCKNKDRDIDR